VKAQAIINGALRAIGVAAAGYDPTAEEAADGLAALNSLLQSWQAEGLTVPFRAWDAFALTIGTASYTWGTGETLNAAPPVRVEDGTAYLSDANATDTPVALMGAGEWSRMASKSVSGRPGRIYVEYSDPVAVEFDFAPDQAYTLHVQSLKAFTAFAALTSEDTVPDEYLPALKWNLAVDLAPEYGKDPSVTVATRARSTKNAILGLAFARRPPISTVDKGLLPGPQFNINTG